MKDYMRAQSRRIAAIALFLSLTFFVPNTVGNDPPEQVATDLERRESENQAIEEIRKFKVIADIEFDKNGHAVNITLALGGMLEYRDAAKQVNGQLPSHYPAAKHVSCLPYLRRLRLNATDFGPTEYSYLSELPYLEELVLEGIRLSDEVCRSLIQLRQIRSLHISCCHLTDARVQALLTLTNLRELGLYGEGKPLTDGCLKDCKKLAHLEKLSVLGCMTDKCLEHLQELPRLRKLDITSPNVTAEGIAAFRKLRPDVAIEVRPR